MSSSLPVRCSPVLGEHSGVAWCRMCIRVLPRCWASLPGSACAPGQSQLSSFLSLGCVLYQSFRRTEARCARAHRLWALSFTTPAEGHRSDVLVLCAEQTIQCHSKGKAGQGGCSSVQMNKIQPLLSSITCFTWTGPILAMGAPGAEELQCLNRKVAMVVSPVLEQMSRCVHLC